MKRIASLGVVLIATTVAFAFQSNWVKFQSPEGRFSVLLPAQPKETKETTQSPVGPYTTTLFISKGAGETYIAAWIDYDPSLKFDDQKELEANRDNFITGVKGTLVSSNNIVFRGYPALEFDGTTPTYSFKSRVYIVGKRPYMLLASYLKAAESSQNINKFFSSFEVKPKT
jgi:hypothetical protein